jgi:hypothetical protein
VFGYLSTFFHAAIICFSLDIKEIDVTLVLSCMGVFVWGSLLDGVFMKTLTFTPLFGLGNKEIDVTVFPLLYGNLCMFISV